MDGVDFRVVVPARYGSSRLPGKPLLEIAGKPLIQHVWERAGQSEAAEVVVATDDARIARVCQAFGADVALTRTDHRSGTDRIAEVI
jgi:3-deoxy-manno-octulosonate cytidylyltransferase (CMP-KDO synthetase)